MGQGKNVSEMALKRERGKNIKTAAGVVASSSIK